jgi:thiol:disulfide interchange protein DsbC
MLAHIDNNARRLDLKKLTKIAVSTTLAASVLLPFSASADQSLTEHMRKVLPGTPITSAERVPSISGLIELTMGKHILYASEDGSIVVAGHLYDTRLQQDITQAKIDKLNKINWKDLPFEHGITIQKGNGSREFAVFTDVDCPFCRRLEQSLSHLTDYKVHVFFFAIKPSGRAATASIWCSEDRGQAFTNYMLEGQMPSADPSSCNTKSLEITFKFAEQNGVSGTPALIGKNGVVKPGFMEPAQLDAWLNQNGR